MEEMVKLLLDSGVAVVVIAFELWKDYKFTGQINESLTKLSVAIDGIKNVLVKKEDE